MRRYHFLGVLGALLLAAGFGLLMQSQVQAQDEPEDPPFLAEFYHDWLGSAHADAEAEAFVHWDAEGEIPTTCAKCHSTAGYQDFLGADGTDFGVVDNAAPIGTTITCDACHNSVASTLTTVTFPSGAEITDASGSARCMQCHQGRASTVSVNAAIEEAGLTEDPNTVSADLGFINIHYYAAAATLYGTEAMGGYQYDGMAYQMKNDHVEGFNTCTGCHMPHTLELRIDECATCHEDVESVDDLHDIRMNGTQVDYDGDGDMDEGIAGEIETLQETLMEAMQAYASEVAGTPLGYNEAVHPYFFIDTDESGDIDETEAVRENAFNAFTANLLRASYNYQVTLKDPGGFAHNPTYHIQLLYDSITMLNEQLSEPVGDLAFGSRTDPGHFNTTAEAFRHWDAEGEVPGTCAKCHTAGGLPIFLKNGVTIATEPSNSLTCTTCHTSLTTWDVHVVNEVTFPSGAKVSFGEEEASNLCLNCHQGRESTVSVNQSIAQVGVGDDETSDDLRFRNVHYFAAGASLFGSETHGAYEYDGKAYNGRNMHAEDAPTTCTECHYEHEPSLRISRCDNCHEEVEEQADVEMIRLDEENPAVDYDGDGDVSEPIRDEIAALEDALLASMQAYASEAGVAIIYNASSYPYWFIDTNCDGVGDPDEINGENGYAPWTPNLVRAAYNYQYVQKDPGAFAHNPDYILQVLYDSIESVGGADAVASLTRAPVIETE